MAHLSPPHYLNYGKLWGQTCKLISRNGKARASAGIYLGDGKSFETEVREAYETSRANREMSINKSDPTVPRSLKPLTASKYSISYEKIQILPYINFRPFLRK
jgi:hypothetical protein